MKLRENNKKDIAYLTKELDTNIPEGGNVIGYFQLNEDETKINGFSIIAFVNYYKVDIELYVVGVGAWLSKSLLNHMFTYIFKKLDCKRCTLRIANKNKKAISLALRLNFVKEGDLRGLDTGLYSLLREECNYG